MQTPADGRVGIAKPPDEGARSYAGPFPAPLLPKTVTWYLKYSCSPCLVAPVDSPIGSRLRAIHQPKHLLLFKLQNLIRPSGAQVSRISEPCSLVLVQWDSAHTS